MKNQLLLIISLFFISMCMLASCGKGGELGGCSVSCGGSGTGQPFVQTNYRFINEADCRTKGEEKGGGCKASYCPPTGNSDDCYQVYP